MRNKTAVRISGICCLLLSSPSLMAFELINNDTTTLNTEGEVILGLFSSEKSYQLRTDDGADWAEGFGKFGLAGETKVGSGLIYGKANALVSFTGGDGDAAGFSTGDESEITKEDLFVGFKNELFDVSVGSQNFVIGDGFILSGDALNFGEGFDQFDIDLDRGGAYWLAARKAFNSTFIVKIGGEEGPRADLFYLNSNNGSQASLELAGVNVEYITAKGTFGISYISGLDVNDREAAFLGLSHRDGQDTTSIRFQGNAGIENLFLSAEYVDQNQGDSTRRDATTGYAELGWTFADTPWSPSVNYRYTSYDEDYDPLFNGFSRGYGTWFQGEVAANYAGPFNSNANVQHIGLKASPSETLTIGAGIFDFEPKEGQGLEATEINLWGEYVANDHLIISPLIGVFNPRNSAANGGSQIGDAESNLYVQVLAIVPF